MTWESRIRKKVLKIPIDVIDWAEVQRKIIYWAKQRQSRYVCICNVHSVVTGKSDQLFRKVIQEADIATPDGMPLVWMLRFLGFPKQDRINGPDLLERLCISIPKKNISAYFYGSSAETLKELKSKLTLLYPDLEIAGMASPPYRKLSRDEDQAYTNAINKSGANIVFVSLGCPKQERWMAEHRGRINAVMIGVGAAFDYHAGTIVRAPLWMQKNGLEWLFRLVSEPSRLWRRYIVTNTLFIIGALRQIILRD